MNPMSLPRATLFTIGALVAALIGWGALIYQTVSYNDAEERWTAERTTLDGRVAELTMDELRARKDERRGSGFSAT